MSILVAVYWDACSGHKPAASGGHNRRERDATGASRGSHLIGSGRGATWLRKCHEVQEMSNYLGCAERQEQDEAREKGVMWCWQRDTCDVRTLHWRHIGQI